MVLAVYGCENGHICQERAVWGLESHFLYLIIVCFTVSYLYINHYTPFTHFMDPYGSKTAECWSYFKYDQNLAVLDPQIALVIHKMNT